jgi:alpha-mannosidase
MWNVDDVREIRVTETGPVRGALLITRRFSGSTISETIYLYRDIARIDFSYSIEWKLSQVLLKTSFPIDINADEASYEIQYGNVTRPTHRNTSWDEARFEVCGHSWADLSENGFGVSILNDSKYGWDIHDGDMRLTLIKSGVDPDPQADRGRHEFTYSLYPHSGAWKKGGTQFMARRLNVPLFSRVEAAHSGRLGAEYSFAALDRDNVIIEVITKAEDNNDVILRLYEYQNERTEVTLTLRDEYVSIYECDLMENNTEKRGEKTKTISFTIKPFEIKTFRLVF